MRGSGLAGSVALAGILLLAGPGGGAASFPAATATVSALEPILRYADPPVVASGPAGPEWRAAVDCAPPVSLPSLIGARVGFAYDFDLDGIADAADSLGVSPADCSLDGTSAPGRIALTRRLGNQGGSHRDVGSAGDAAVLRADLLTAGDSVVARHLTLTTAPGRLLRIVRYCARPRNGEPEWIEVRNVSSRPLALTQVRLEGRVVSGSPSSRLAPGESFMAASDTAELRLWQPGHHAVALSSWSNLRNSGDTLRLTLTGPPATDLPKAPAIILTLDSLVYGPAADPSEGCASLAGEGSSAAASGYALEVSAPRWSRAGSPSGSVPFAVTVRAPAGGRYDLSVYDLDGRPLCALAREAAGPVTIPFPPAACPALVEIPAGHVILQLSPHHAPRVRTLLRIGR